MLTFSGRNIPFIYSIMERKYLETKREVEPTDIHNKRLSSFFQGRIQKISEKCFVIHSVFYWECWNFNLHGKKFLQFVENPLFGGQLGSLGPFRHKYWNVWTQLTQLFASISSSIWRSYHFFSSHKFFFEIVEWASQFVY